ncbi:MAG: dihydropteroate synthase [Candidatus Amulumruptor caecigallinarius]|nr:dihydropteroate synthase [Candidatus Amulumruptor caecigallinarius]
MKHTLNIRGTLHFFSRPLVMGIINITPDSFYAASRVAAEDAVRKAAEMLESGADILDIGAFSSRPGCDYVTAEEEISRLSPTLAAIRASFPEAILSVDTFRGSVAREAISGLGADIINDIGGGTLDSDMWTAVSELQVPYILMHMRGNTSDMMKHTDYNDIVAEVLSDLSKKVACLRELGVNDIIVDPGFGFSKTTPQNYEILASLNMFHATGCPVLAGISRKTMIREILGTSADESLNGTTVLNTLALMRGADILRVHDVRDAVEAVKLYEAFNQADCNCDNIIQTTDYPHI